MNCLRGALFPLSHAYALGRKLHVALSRRRFEGEIPVIIVGNLTTGGTGKSPLVAHLVGLCRRAKAKCVVVSRGYKGSRSKDPAVVSDGRRKLMSSGGAGDEPFMLARMLEGVPVVVGRDRVRACELAVRRLGARALVLDDGYQQRHRFPGAFCALAINSRQALFDGRLLPAGSLREPPAAAADAQALILTHGAPVELRKRLGKIAPHALVLGARHRLVGFSPIFGARIPSLASLKGMKVAALSAIGFPQGFADLLKVQGEASRVISRAFRDHHAWRKSEIDEVMRSAIRDNCAAVIVTAKDAARMPRPASLSLPVYAAEIRMSFAKAEEDRLERALGRYLRLFRV